MRLIAPGDIAVAIAAVFELDHRTGDGHVAQDEAAASGPHAPLQLRQANLRCTDALVARVDIQRLPVAAQLGRLAVRQYRHPALYRL
ncbi:hypothetical protein D3C71_1690500 [compost metagenome]